MAEMVIMPKLGFDMAEGTLVRWVKGEGENVSKGDVLAEIETDKATVEVESFFDGVLHKHLVETGAVVPVGTPIAVVAQPGETVDMSQFEQADVQEGQETGASTKEPERPLPTQPEPKDAAPAETAAVVQPAPAEPAEVEEGEEVISGDGRIKASPLARRVAEEKGLDLARIKGTGPGGRIVRKDVEAAAAAPAAAATAPSAPAAPAKEEAPARKPAVSLPIWTPGAVEARPDEREELTRLRTIIGRRMTESKQNFPDFSITHLYKMDKALALRKQINDLLPAEQKVSVNDMIIKATALALREFPNLNASLDGNAVVRHGAINIGVAVAVPGGLMTVVVKNADVKPLRVIAQEAREMASRAREGKVRPEDIEGSTFSISNLGMFDVEQFVAIINPPEAAILAAGSAQEMPVVDNGEITIGWRMKMSISADHRVTDGAEAAQFMQAIAKYLEEPLLLLA